MDIATFMRWDGMTAIIVGISSILAGIPKRFPLLALEVEDIQTTVEHMQMHNVELLWGLEEDGYSRRIMFHDPGGNLIEIAEFT